MTYFSNLADVSYLREEDKIKITDIQDLVLEGTNLYNRVMREFNKMEIEGSESLRNPHAMRQLDTIIAKSNSGLNTGIVLRINDKITYVSENIDDQGFLSGLPGFGANFSKAHTLDFDGDYEYIINEQHDFYFEDGEKGTFFIGTYMTPMIIKTDIFNIVFRRIGMVALIIIGFFIALSIYKEVQKSLDELTEASEHIKDGIYDKSIVHRPKNELGDLIGVFEEMRVKLGKSLTMQKKYEDDRKYMLSSMSHDLKTPIMSIKGYIQGIQDGIATSPEKHDKYMNIIYKEAENLETMINELFLYSKLDLKQEVFFFKEIDIVSYFRFCIEDLELELKEHNGSIKLLTNEETIMVKADLQKLKRVIMNVFNNSLKYSAEKAPELEICISRDGDYVKIEMRDNGIGISKHALPNIFSKFYRVDKSRNTSVKGSGIGLAIAKQIIESHKGSIWASSVEGDGTLIGFKLPIMKADKGDRHE